MAKSPRGCTGKLMIVFVNGCSGLNSDHSQDFLRDLDSLGSPIHEKARANRLFVGRLAQESVHIGLSLSNLSAYMCIS